MSSNSPHLGVVWLLAAVAAGAACSVGSGSGAQPGASADAAELADAVELADAGELANADASPSSGSDAGNIQATTEVCDGIDNDGDGIIDNVDLNHDGICDCLNIATLGYPGSWGQGDVFNDWLAGRTSSSGGVVALASQTLTAQALAPFQVLVVQDVRSGSGSEGIGNGIGRSYSDAEVEALSNWVKAGGGVMTLIGYADASERENVNKLLAPFGLSYDSAGIYGTGTDSTVPITHWAQHPISDGVQQVGVNGGYPVSGGTLLAWESQPGNWDLGRVVEYGSGHVFAWGDEWITYNSEWKSHPDYQIRAILGERHQMADGLRRLPGPDGPELTSAALARRGASSSLSRVGGASFRELTSPSQAAPEALGRAKGRETVDRNHRNQTGWNERASGGRSPASSLAVPRRSLQ